MDRGDDRLAAVFDDVEDVVQARFLRRLAEFGDVGSGEEGPPAANQDDRLHRIVGGECAEPFVERLPDVDAERVDRRRIDRDDPDAVLDRERAHTH